MLVRIIAIFVALGFATPLLASDLEKEQRWREQVADSIMDGEEVDVVVDGRDVFGIYTEAEVDSDKGMIVVHGTGIHPNWDQVVQPVRVGMAEKGWHTLSIQMPVLANDAEYQDYVPLYPQVPARLKAAEAFLLDKGVSTIVIVAHSQGATMSSYYLARNDSEVKALVAIGMGAAQKDSEVNSAESLKRINIPVLDLYGSDDLAAVLETADKRKAASAHNAAYGQQVIEGANHFFDDYNDELIESVARWLEQI
jgi:pimeloyl-ACP methyl ester carboxylesterase